MHQEQINPERDNLIKCCKWIDWARLENSVILITGATGLIGFNIIKELCEIRSTLNLRILALVRDSEKARIKFRDYADQIRLLQGDILHLPEIDVPVDYIIHGASITSSRAFVESPVETIMTSVLGTKNLLELAKVKKVKSMVYLSSMEMYGSFQEKELLTEDKVGYLNPLQLRSSYPESKRMCENLCVAYHSEYGVPVKIARLAQTFGPGIPKNDSRVFVQFLDSALQGKDIEIKTAGKSARMYVYTFDAVTAIFSVLIRGKDAVAFNIANKKTYCSIHELAVLISDKFGKNSRVLVNTGNLEETKMYPPDSFLYLDTTRLESLGWKAQYSLEEGLCDLVTDRERNI